MDGELLVVQGGEAGHVEAGVKPSFDDFAAMASTRLLRAAFLLSGDRHAAEDLVQGTLERLFVAWRRVDGDPYAYAYRTLVNLASNERRWRRRHPQTGLPLAGDPVAAGFGREHSNNVAARRDVVALLQQVPPRQRAVKRPRFSAALIRVAALG